MDTKKNKMNRDGHPGPRPKQAFTSGTNYKGEVKEYAKKMGGSADEECLNYGKNSKSKGGY